MSTASAARSPRPSRWLGPATLAAALVAAGSAHGLAEPPHGAAEPPHAVAGPQACPPGLPFVLNVALPAGEVVDRRELDRLGSELETLFKSDRVALQPCVLERGLQVNVALGSDYQVLHWLEDGAVDLAVLSELSLHLARRSGLELFEIAPPPDALVPARRARLLSRDSDGDELPDAQGDFEVFLTAVWRASGEPVDPDASAAGTRLELGSHLDTARFLVPVAEAQRWLDALPGDVPAARRDRFWSGFFDRACLVFPGDRGRRAAGVPCHGPGRAAAGAGWRPVVEVAEEMVQPAPSAAGGPARLAFGAPVRDRLVVRSGPAASLLAGELGPAEVTLPPEILSLLGVAAPGAKDGPRAPAAFARLVDPEAALGVRTFAFTPEETVRLLWADQRVSSRSRLGLVLPGGGVKAAYQSRVSDALYQGGFLKNAGAGVAPGPPRRALDVDTVIGTSGGALLGFFVARLGEAGPWNLSCLLWSEVEACRPDDEHGFLDSSDIFPGLDLLRYLSLLVVFLVLSLLLTLFGLRPGAPLAPDRHAAPAARPALRLQWGLLAASVLTLTPVLVRLANGDQVVEHVPEVQGLLFFVLLLLVVFADQCLVLAGQPPRRLRSLRWIGMSLVLASVVALALPLALLGESRAGLRALLTAPAGLDVPLGGLLVSLGALGLLLGQVVAFIAWAPYYRVERFGTFLHAIGLALFHASLVLVVVWAASRLAGDSASFFELTGVYWLWLLAAALAIGLALIAWGLWGGRPRRLVTAIRTGLDYLSSPHPNGRLVRRRYARVLFVSAGSLVWWNLVLAPAAYGNAEAVQYLARVAERFDERYGAAYPDENAYRLRARFLTPANALEEDGTRFFLFVPQEGSCPAVAQRPGSGGTWQRYRVVVANGSAATDRGCEPLDLRLSAADAERDQAYLRNVVFASGSPFPVFPAHRVRRGEAKAEPLVDGGYTNNLPLDPALALGLEQVLILQSSHPYAGTPGPPPAGLQMLAGVPGPLVKQLFRLPGFLYGRSQQLDRRSRGALFVASLAPSADEHDWPFLTDFRSRRVRQMLTTAERDLGRRIGSVESWGPPSFQGSVSVVVAGAANGDRAR